ncbi:hypothetical protein ACM3CU_17175 [Edwardsiella ictaluri]|uniref:hypothetical protein n=1 Tax=Edwardsiella ictaluri TaxID=67780 RepID=UPI0039F6A19D
MVLVQLRPECQASIAGQGAEDIAEIVGWQRACCLSDLGTGIQQLRIVEQMGIVQTAEQTIANGLFRQQDLQNTRTRLRTLLCIER